MAVLRTRVSSSPAPSTISRTSRSSSASSFTPPSTAPPSPLPHSPPTELTPRENDAAFQEFKAFTRGMEYWDPGRAEVLRAIYSACVMAGFPLVLRFGEVRVDGRWVEGRREDLFKRGREGSVESVESEEDGSGREEMEREKERLEDKARERDTGRERTRGRKYVLVGENPGRGRREDGKGIFVGYAQGAKLYLLFDRDLTVRRGKEWIAKMRYGAEFKGLRENIGRSIGDLEERKSFEEEKERRVDFGKVGGGKRKWVLLRTGSVFERERTEEREKKRVKVESVGCQDGGRIFASAGQ